MKKTEGYRIRKLEDEYVVLPFGKRAEEVNEVISLSETAGFMYLVEINFICMLPEVKGKITQQTDTETTVQIMLQHMMDHIKNIFRRRQNRVGKIIDRL